MTYREWGQRIHTCELSDNIITYNDAYRRLAVGVARIHGPRATQEDTYAIAERPMKQKPFESWFTPTATLLGVFDGHSGGQVSELCRAVLFDFICQTDAWAECDFSLALYCGFLAFDEWLKSIPCLDKNIGSTAIVVVFYMKDVWIANIGDGQAILVKKDKSIVPLSTIHHLEDMAEKERVEAAGMQIWHSHCGPRIRHPDGSSLEPSRAFGDFRYKCNTLAKNKQAVNACPEIQHYYLQPDDHYIVLGSDGLWNNCSPKEIVSIISDHSWRIGADYVASEKCELEWARKRKYTVAELAGEIASYAFRKCIKPDNITVAVCGKLTNYIDLLSNTYSKDHLVPSNLHTSRTSSETCTCLENPHVVDMSLINMKLLDHVLTEWVPRASSSSTTSSMTTTTMTENKMDEKNADQMENDDKEKAFPLRNTEHPIFDSKDRKDRVGASQQRDDAEDREVSYALAEREAELLNPDQIGASRTDAKNNTDEKNTDQIKKDKSVVPAEQQQQEKQVIRQYNTRAKSNLSSVQTRKQTRSKNTSISSSSSSSSPLKKRRRM